MPPPTKTPKASKSRPAAETTDSAPKPRAAGRPPKGQEKRQIKARPEEMDRAIDLLGQLVDTLGKSRRKVDQQLGTGRSRTSQILSRRLDLKFQHILDILDALGIETRAFFEILYSEEKRDPFPGPLAVIYQQKLRELGATAPAGPAPEPPPLPPLVTEDDVKRLIDARLAEAFSVLTAKKPES